MIRPGSMDRHSNRGVQKYLCKGCNGVFSLRVDKGKKYGFDFKTELARMHVEERMSYRVMSKRLKEKLGLTITPRYLCKMVNEVAQMSKSSIEISLEYKPKWDGYIAVDDKYVRVHGERYLSLVAVDTTGDPVHIELLQERSQEAYDNFFKYLVDHIGYRVRAITTDLDPMLDSAVKNVFDGKILHQKCIWHGLEIVKSQIDLIKAKQGYFRFKKRYDAMSASLEDKKAYYHSTKEKLGQMKNDLYLLQEEYLSKEKLLATVREMLTRKTEHDISSRLTSIKRKYANKYPQVVSFLLSNLEGLTTHTINQDIPKTNIMAESFNRQLQRRLKTIESFQTVATAFNYLNMIRNYIRFKPFTDCKGKRKYRNTRSPIELCGVNLLTRDWIKNSINYPKLSTAD
jgi:transposase-like protein